MEKQLLELLKEYSYSKGNFTLSSGLKSEHYINCKPVTLSSRGICLVSHLILDKIGDCSTVAGLTLGADPLVCGVSLLSSSKSKPVDAIIVRKEAKGHGTKSWLEGPLPQEGSKITVLEDVTTTGGSAIKAVKKLRDCGYLVTRVVTIVDRILGAKEKMEKEGIELISLYTIKDFC